MTRILIITRVKMYISYRHKNMCDKYKNIFLLQSILNIVSHMYFYFANVILSRI